MATGTTARPADKPSALVDTRVIYCGENLEQLKKFPDACIDLIYIDPPFNSNRNYEVFWGETKEKRAFEDRHASTQAYIEFMRPFIRPPVVSPPDLRALAELRGGDLAGLARGPRSKPHGSRPAAGQAPGPGTRPRPQFIRRGIWENAL